MRVLKEIIDFYKADKKETIEGLIAWGSMAGILFMLSIIGG